MLRVGGKCDIVCVFVDGDTAGVVHGEGRGGIV